MDGSSSPPSLISGRPSPETPKARAHPRSSDLLRKRALACRSQPGPVPAKALGPRPLPNSKATMKTLAPRRLSRSASLLGLGLAAIGAASYAYAERDVPKPPPPVSAHAPTKLETQQKLALADSRGTGPIDQKILAL